MKPACFLIGAPGGAGAIASHFSTLGEELARRGHTVKFISSREDLENCRATTNPAQLVWPSRRPTGLADALFLARLIRSSQADCLVANFGAVNWMCLIGRLCRVPHRIAFYHTLSSQLAGDHGAAKNGIPQWLRFRKRVVYGSATILAGISQIALRDAQAAYGVPAERCRFWRYSMADPAARIPLLPASRREDLIVCAGRFHPSKGQQVFLSAMGMLTKSCPTTQLEFLGDGPLLEKCRSLAQTLGIADRCHFRGQVAPDIVLERMARAKITVVPSLHEAFGLVNVESLAVGTPAIASHVDGIPEIIRNGEDGWLVPPGDSKAMAEKIGLMLRDNSLRDKMGQQGRQRFLETYELSSMMPQQAEWLERLVSPLAPLNVG